MTRAPNFLAMATAHRRFYEICEAEAAKRPDCLVLDSVESDVAEVTTYAIAACIAAHEHGLSREVLRQMLDSCIEDVWR